MADKASKVGSNVTGAWFVDTNCINCNLCCTTAPENFQTNDDEGFAYVAKQPASADELAQCEEAKASCPVEAIGNDGVCAGSSQVRGRPGAGRFAFARWNGRPGGKGSAGAAV